MQPEENDLVVENSSQELPDRGHLLPAQIQTDERFNVRKYDPTDDYEMKLVEDLATTMERDGQLDDIILVPVEDGKLVLLAGHRRRRAATLINERRSAENRPLFKLRYQVNREGGDLFRKAVISNLQRRDFSPMDLTLLIKRIKQENNWAGMGFKGSKKTAEYLGISVANVTQHEKFSLFDEEMQQKLHRGEISAHSAYDLMEVKPEKRAEVLSKASEIQQDRNIDQAIESTQSGRESGEKAATKMHSKKRIENPAIKQAIRETPDATDTPQPMSRREIVEWLLQFDSPVYGGLDSAVRQWVVAMDKMMAGKGGRNADKSARDKFDAMVKGSSKGTLDGEHKRQVAPKSSTGKALRKDKGVTKTKQVSAHAKSKHAKA